MKCFEDVRNRVTKCRPQCHGEHFSLFGMSQCHPWLDCDSISEEVSISGHIIGGGAVKLVKLGLWKSRKVAVNYLRDEAFKDDFLHNIQMLKMFNSQTDELSDRVIQLIGFCTSKKSVPFFITEYLPLGSVNEALATIEKDLSVHDLLWRRFSLCLDYVYIISLLHEHENGTRILCDSNDPEKAVSQFLLSDSFRLVLNDVDALPIVNSESGILAKCGHKELYGDYVAPEQVWPYDDLPFDDSLMQGYTEKVDVWKIPDVFNYLMNNVLGSNKQKLYLFNIHSQCKNEDPALRPSAKDVYLAYRDCFKMFDVHNDI